jgi:hypothetical protein
VRIWLAENWKTLVTVVSLLLAATLVGVVAGIELERSALEAACPARALAPEPLRL